MSADFTIVISVRQGFGNEPGYLNSIEPDVPFVGPTKDFTFSCPNVNPNEAAVLMFQSRDVDSSRNIITINGSNVFGGIPVSPNKDTWNGNVMLIAAGILRASGNELHIEARNTSGGGGGDIDDFILDNVVVFFHCTRGCTGDPTSAAEIKAALDAVGHVSLNSRVVYEITESIVLPDNCVVDGNGAEIRCTGGNYPAFVIKDLDFARINNLYITRPGFGTIFGAGAEIGDGVAAQNVKHLVLDGVRLKDHANGIALKDCVSPIPDVINAGTPCSTAYAYLVVAVADGLAFEIERPGATATGNATLTGVNYNTIQWADLLSIYTTIEYRIYRTAGGATQGLIGTVCEGVKMFNDKGIVATGSVPDSPRHSPMTNTTIVGVCGSTIRKYTVIAVIDGVRWAHYDIVTETAGHATLDESNYTIVSWPRLYGVEGFVTETYEIYRTQGGGSTGTSAGLLGTVSAASQFSDTGIVATTALPSIPPRTRNSRVTIANTTVRHSAATKLNSQYHLLISSTDYLAIENSHFGGDENGVGGAWLDGVKGRSRVFSVRWVGGSANYNGKSYSDGGAGDGADFFSGIHHLDVSGVEMLGNGGAALVSKTVGWWQAGGVGSPELGVPNTTRIRGVVAKGNFFGIALDNIEDDELVSGEDPLRGRVRDTLISDSFLEDNHEYGLKCNAQGVRISNTVIRGNKKENVWLGKQASSVTFDGVAFLGASSGNAAGFPHVTVDGEIVIKTLAADLALGATSFSIPNADNVPLSGRVSLGRLVAGVTPASTYESWDYTRVGTTITLAHEAPGEADADAVTIFNHNAGDGPNALDVGFSAGAKKIKFINCRFNGKELHGRVEVSLDGGMAALTTVTRNNIEIQDGADEIQIIDNEFRFVTSDPYCAPYVPYAAADGCFSARILLRHADAFHATPVNRYYGGIGSEYISLRQARTGGPGAIGLVKYRKETLLADTRTGWIPSFESSSVQTRASDGAVSISTKTTLLSITGTRAYTIAAGAYEGQQKTLDCTVAASTPIGTLTGTFIRGATAHTTITFAAVGQAVDLEYHATGGWRILRVRPDTATSLVFPVIA